jgi:hypothetical protein
VTVANTGGFGYALYNLLLQVLPDPAAALKLADEAAFEVATPRIYIPYPAPGALSTWRNNGLASMPIVLSDDGGDETLSQDGQVQVSSGPPVINSTEQILLQGLKEKQWRIVIDLGNGSGQGAGGK